MKTVCRLCLAVMCLSLFAVAQEKPANPVSDSLRSLTQRYTKILVDTASTMPAENYGFKPMPDMNSFGHVIGHIAQSNYFLCNKLTGAAAPELKLGDNDSKDKLVQALKDSFDFCNSNLAKLDDSQMGEEVTLFGGRKAPKASAVIGLAGDFYDHYGALAVYMRLKGVLPPTAQRQPAASAEKKN